MKDKKLNVFNLISIITLITTVIMVVALGNIMKRLENIENTTHTNDAQLSDFQAPTGAKNIDKKDISSTADSLLTSLEKAQKSNVKYVGYEGEDKYGLYTTNESGESIWMQSDNSILVFENNNKVVSFNDTKIGYGEDLSPVNTVTLACKAVKNGYASISKVELNNDDKKATEYLFDIQGYDNIEKMYKIYNTKFASDKITKLKTSIESASSTIKDLKGDKNILNIRFAVVISDNNVASLGEYFYFGNNSGGYWDNCVPEWSFDSGSNTNTWKIDDSWYKYDYTNMDSAKLSGMKDTLINSVYTALGITEADLKNSSESDTTANTDSDNTK